MTKAALTCARCSRRNLNGCGHTGALLTDRGLRHALAGALRKSTCSARVGYAQVVGSTREPL